MPSGESFNRCPACDSETLDSDRDIPGKVCQGCGLVYDGGDWAYDPSEAYEAGIQTESKSKTESEWQDEVTIRDASDQQLVRILSNVDDLADHLSLGAEEQETAVELAVEVWEQNLMHGRKLESVIAGVVYTTCRKSGQPRPGHTVAKAAEIGERKLRNASKIIVQELNLEIDPPKAKGYIPYLSSQLGLASHLERDAFEILQNTETTGGNPAAIAVAALYTATQSSDSLTLQEAGQAAGVSKETVWRHSSEFK